MGVSHCFLNQTNKKNISLTDPPPQLWQECCRMTTEFFFAGRASIIKISLAILKKLYFPLQTNQFKVHRLQIIVVAKKCIYMSQRFISIGCLKCMQFHNWFRLQLNKSTEVNVSKDFELLFEWWQGMLLWQKNVINNITGKVILIVIHSKSSFLIGCNINPWANSP